MTAARLQGIITAARTTEIVDELKLYPICDRMMLATMLTLPSGKTSAVTEQGSEWYVAGTYVVIDTPLQDHTHGFQVKSYDTANRLYHGWGIANGTLQYEQTGIYDAEHRIMTWHTVCHGEQAGSWALSIQRFVSATRNEWLTSCYQGASMLFTQKGSCDFTVQERP